MLLDNLDETGIVQMSEFAYTEKLVWCSYGTWQAD